MHAIRLPSGRVLHEQMRKRKIAGLKLNTHPNEDVLPVIQLAAALFLQAVCCAEPGRLSPQTKQTNQGRSACRAHIIQPLTTTVHLWTDLLHGLLQHTFRLPLCASPRLACPFAPRGANQAKITGLGWEDLPFTVLSACFTAGRKGGSVYRGTPPCTSSDVLVQHLVERCSREAAEIAAAGAPPCRRCACSADLCWCALITSARKLHCNQ